MADYAIQVENHGVHTGILGNPHGTFYMRIPGGETVEKDIPLAQLKNMQSVIVAMEAKELANEDPEFTVVLKDPNGDAILFENLPCSEAGAGIFVAQDQGL